MNQQQKNSIPTYVAILILLSAGVSSCHQTENTALLIAKKAKEQAAKLNFSKEIHIESPIEQLENALYTPTISTFFVEKEDLMTTW